jgi:23S rRNA pseudouridine1911/1915/1917 synthase
MQNIHLNLTIPLEYAGQRLDGVLATLIPEHSRARIQHWIKDGHLLVNQKPTKNRHLVVGEEQVTIDAPPLELPSFTAEDIPLDVLFEDDDIIIINKPVGLVAHPATGNYAGTLLNALLFRFPELNEVPRAGIIHRLDKDTSGVLVVARNVTAHTKLVADLQAREMKREYIAVVQGEVTAGRTIETEIGRHPRSRTKMAVIHNGKRACTHFRIGKRFKNHTLLNVQLDTGRTHQIRVHMAHIKHPVIGDKTYGQLRLPKKASPPLIDTLRAFQRQALHAERLTLKHPTTGEMCEFTAPMPADLQHLIATLKTEDA